MKFFFHMTSWVNLIILSLYYSGIPIGTLDNLLSISALVPTLEVLHVHTVDVSVTWLVLKVPILFATDGFKETLMCHHKPAQQMATWSTLFCTVVAVTGVLAIHTAAGDGFIAINTARALAGFASLCIFTKSSHFGEIMQTLFGVISATLPLLSLLLAVNLLFALGANCMFGSKALDDFGSSFFGSYGRALTTVFRLFVGEGAGASIVC